MQRESGGFMKRCAGGPGLIFLLLVSPEVIERIDWPEKKVHLRLARETILQAPEVRL